MLMESLMTIVYYFSVRMWSNQIWNNLRKIFKKKCSLFQANEKAGKLQKAVAVVKDTESVAPAFKTLVRKPTKRHGS